MTLGDPVIVQAQLLNERFEPLIVNELAGSFRCGAAAGSFVLTAQAQRPGWYQGSFAAGECGTCELRVSRPPGEAEPVALRKQIQVTRPRGEVAQSQLHRDPLIALTSQLEQSYYYAIDEVDQLPGRIADQHETKTVTTQPQALWDNGWALGVLIVLLGLEWAGRKWWRLL